MRMQTLLMRQQRKLGTEVPAEVIVWTALLLTQGLADSSTKNYERNYQRHWVGRASKWKFPSKVMNGESIAPTTFCLVRTLGGYSYSNMDMSHQTLQKAKSNIVNEIMIWTNWKTPDVNSTIMKRLVKGHAWYSAHEMGKFFPFQTRHVLVLIYYLTQNKGNDPEA